MKKLLEENETLTQIVYNADKKNKPPNPNSPIYKLKFS